MRRCARRCWHHPRWRRTRSQHRERQGRYLTARVQVTFLGGLGDVGRNCTVVEVDGRLLVIDFGVMFPTPDMPGVWAVLPDITWLTERADDIEAVVITHGHEDHLGGLSYLLKEISAPVYGSALTMGLVDAKLSERRLGDRTQLNVLADGERRQLGPFDLEVLPITHSVPQSLCVVLHTPQGVLVHTGDFKIDHTPVDGRLTDLGRLAELAAGDGVRLLMADSTNADRPGRSASETEVGATLRRLIEEHPNQRIVAACFASHLHRVQQLADAAVACGRVVVPVGRSMVANCRIARNLGVLRLADEHWASADQLDYLDDSEVLVVCTGSQGEQRAALAQLAAGTHRSLAVGGNDVVILSSHPIPGNERPVARVINRLCQRGAKVVHSGHEEVHTSGHACRDELAELHEAVRPEWFVPIEGEYHMLARHAELAVNLGHDPDRVLVLTDGSSVELADDGVKVRTRTRSPYRMVDGPVDDVTPELLAERRLVGEGGVVSVAVGIARRRGKWELAGEPQLRTVGWIDEEISSGLLAELADEVARAAQKGAGELGRGVDEHAAATKVTKRVKRAAGAFVGARTKRSPRIQVSVLPLAV